MSEDGWIKWSEGVQRAEEAGFGRSLLLDWVRADALKARAHSLFVGSRILRQQIIPKALWDGSISWDQEGEARYAGWPSEFKEIDILSERMEYDRKRGVIPATILMRAVGIEFARADFDALIPRAVETSPPEWKAKQGPGRPGNVSGWHRIYFELVKMADDGELRAFKSQAELRAELLRRVNDEFSVAAIKPIVRRIWNALEIG